MKALAIMITNMNGFKLMRFFSTNKRLQNVGQKLQSKILSGQVQEV